MALNLYNGCVVKCKTAKTGTSTKGSWCLCKVVDDRGKNMTPLWLMNEDHGIEDGDVDFELRITDLGCASGEGAGAKIGMKEYPKGSGKWVQEISFSGVTAHKVGEAYDGNKDFTFGTFTEIKEPDDGELPF